MIYGRVKGRSASAPNQDEVSIVMTVYSPGQSAYLDREDVRPEKDEECEIILRDEWKATVVQPHDRVNVVVFSPCSTPNRVIVSNTNHNYIIVFPDSLFTATSVASSYCCLRRPILSNFIRSYQESKYSLFGRIRHDLFEVRETPFVKHSTRHRWFTRRRSCDHHLRRESRDWFKSSTRRSSVY